MTRTSTSRRHRRYDAVAVLAYIVKYQRQNQQCSPSQRCIQIGLGVSAPSVVHNLLHRLEHSGLLTITPQGRGNVAELALTEAGYDAVQSWQEDQTQAAPAHTPSGRRDAPARRSDAANIQMMAHR